MILKRALVWLFPAYLLAVQHAGLAHALSHTLKSGAGQEQLAPSDLCSKCVSFAKLAHAATTEPFQTAAPPSVVVGGYEPTTDEVYAERVTPRSRSPPDFL
jgi:hypothetical protein